MSQKTNKGYQYETQLETFYRELGARKGRLGSSDMDLSLAIRGTPIDIEVKYADSLSSAKNLNYGQSKIIQLPDKTWEFEDKTDAEAQERIEILKSAGIMEFVNAKWKTKETIVERIKNARSKEEAALLARSARKKLGGEFRVGISENVPVMGRTYRTLEEIINEEYPFSDLFKLKNAINAYYSRKGASYVQIKNFGLYRLSDADPISEISGGQLQVPRFEPSTVLARVRLKGYGRGKYDFTVALEASGYPPNTVQIISQEERNITEERKASYQIGSSLRIDLDNNAFKNYLMKLDNVLNQ
tara:strand:- start:35 stop:937 length:903 start_codon:yes stop_codon:yes gene_type:complete